MKHKLFQVIFTIAWLVDTIATSIFVNIGGVELEANPIMHWLISVHGIPAFISVKLTILGMWALMQDEPSFKWWFNVVLSIILVPVAIIGTIVAVNFLGVS